MAGDSAAALITLSTTVSDLQKKLTASQDLNRVQADRILELESELTKSKAGTSAQVSNGNGKAGPGDAAEVAALKAKLKKADEVYRALQTSYRKLTAAGGSAPAPSAESAKDLAELRKKLSQELKTAELLRKDVRVTGKGLAALETRYSAEAAAAVEECKAAALRLAGLESGAVLSQAPKTGLKRPAPVQEDDDDLEIID